MYRTTNDSPHKDQHNKNNNNYRSNNNNNNNNNNRLHLNTILKVFTYQRSIVQLGSVGVVGVSRGQSAECCEYRDFADKCGRIGICGA